MALRFRGLRFQVWGSGFCIEGWGFGVGGDHRNLQQFRGGLVFKADRHGHRSTLGLRVTKKKKRVGGLGLGVLGIQPRVG